MYDGKGILENVGELQKYESCVTNKETSNWIFDCCYINNFYCEKILTLTAWIWKEKLTVAISLGISNKSDLKGPWFNATFISYGIGKELT